MPLCVLWRLYADCFPRIDIPALVDHISEVITFSVATPTHVEQHAEDLHQRQELLVFVYLTGLLKSTNHIDESRILPFLREKHIFPLTMQFVNLMVKVNGVSPSHLYACCESLSLIAESEDFGTHLSEYCDVRDFDEVAQAMELVTVCKEHFQSEPAHRTTLRPLMDALSKIRRQASRK